MKNNAASAEQTAREESLAEALKIPDFLRRRPPNTEDELMQIAPNELGLEDGSIPPRPFIKPLIDEASLDFAAPYTDAQFPSPVPPEAEAEPTHQQIVDLIGKLREKSNALKAKAMAFDQQAEVLKESLIRKVENL